MTNVEMERLLKAQRLAAQDVERGVTLEMVRKNREAHKFRKHQQIDHQNDQSSAVERLANQKVSDMIHTVAAETLRNDAIDKLLSKIEATESLEDQLRAKYNL